MALTRGGGTYGPGTVYKINRDGTGYRVLVNFTGILGDGAYAYSPVFQGSDGALYGTTDQAGAHGNGTIYMVDTNGGGYTTLWNFSGSDGSNPDGGLIEGTNGVFFGTTQYGGISNAGTIFALIMAPLIATNVYDESILAGQPVALAVAVSGQPPVTYQWLFNGTPVPLATNSTFSIPSSALTNSGQYQVIVSNSYGRASSRIAQLLVGSPPKNVNATMHAGQSGVALSMSGTPGFRYVLMYTTNLMPPVVWLPVMTNAADTNGVWAYTDTNTAQYPHRYFVIGVP